MAIKTCGRCGKHYRCQELDIYWVMGYCRPCFDWLWKLGVKKIGR